MVSLRIKFEYVEIQFICEKEIRREGKWWEEGVWLSGTERWIIQVGLIYSTTFFRMEWNKHLKNITQLSASHVWDTCTEQKFTDSTSFISSSLFPPPSPPFFSSILLCQVSEEVFIRSRLHFQYSVASFKVVWGGSLSQAF